MNITRFHMCSSAPSYRVGVIVSFVLLIFSCFLCPLLFYSDAAEIFFTSSRTSSTSSLHPLLVPCLLKHVLPLTAQLSYSAIRAALDTETDVFTWDHVESSEVLKQRFQQLSLTDSFRFTLKLQNQMIQFLFYSSR